MVKWSFSSLKDFVNCPKQYHHVKILKDFSKVPSQQMLYGSAVHKSLEDYTKDATPLPKNYERYKKVVDTVLEIPGTRYPEYKMAVDQEKKPCAFDAPEYWVRGIVDLMIVDGETAFVVDYKTGSNRYPDTKQLKLMALMTFAHFPQVNEVRGGLLFVAHDTFVPEEYKRQDEEKLWSVFSADLMRLGHCHETNTWPANPTPLCGWCPVTSCDFNRGV